MTQVEKKKPSYGSYYREIEVTHSLQSTPQDRDWLLSIPKGDVKPTEVVLYLGCNIMRTTHLMRTAVDIFKQLGVDFVAVGGVSYCCGIQHFMNGDVQSSHAVAEATVRNFQKFSPERVVMWCPSRIFFYDDIMEMRESFTFQHFSEFLVENLDKLKFQQEVPSKVGLHYHEGHPQTDAETRSGFKLLSAVPGVDLVDLGAVPKLARQCTVKGRELLGEQEWNEVISHSFQKAVEAEVDTYAPLYHGCHRFLCGYEQEYPLKVEHYLTLVGRALGIEHEDLYKKHLLMGDTEAILEETSPCARASGLTTEEARAVIQKNFAKEKVS